MPLFNESGELKVSFDNSAAATVDSTAGGATQYSLICAATTNTNVVKASAGRVYSYTISNVAATPRYVKLYNKASAPTLASDVPVRRITIPANASVNFSSPVGLAGFTAGIAIAITTGILDNDTGAPGAAEVVANIDYA